MQKVQENKLIGRIRRTRVHCFKGNRQGKPFWYWVKVVKGKTWLVTPSGSEEPSPVPEIDSIEMFLARDKTWGYATEADIKRDKKKFAQEMES